MDDLGAELPEIEFSDDPQVAAIQQQIEEITEGDLADSLKMLQICDQCKDSAVKALVRLDDQGEQLENMEDGLTRINNEMGTAEKGLAEMSKCCGIIMCPWNKTDDGDIKDYEEDWEKLNRPGAPVVKPPENPQSPFKGPKPKDKSMVVKISGNWKEEELEKNLQSVGEAVGNLYKMANDIGQELDKQNQIVTRIGEKSALNKERIAQADKIAQKLLKE